MRWQTTTSRSSPRCARSVEAYEAKRSRRGKKRRTDKKGQKAICSKCEVEYDPGSYRGKSPLCKKCRLKGG